HGLLATLRLPFLTTLGESVEYSATLNLLEAASWTGFSQLGCWHIRQHEGDRFILAFMLFIPNALYARGIATQVAFWFLQRARCARKELWPSLVDETMAEILKRRHQAIAELRKPVGVTPPCGRRRQRRVSREVVRYRNKME